jgi:CRP/FNR family transcriptional regulator
MTNGKEINSCTVVNTNLTCFDHLTMEELGLVDSNMLEITYNKGEIICKQGSFASHIMVIMEGLAKIYLEGNNETLILKILPAVNIIGLTSLIEGNNVFQYSAQAYVPTTVRLIEIGVFRELLNANPKFAAKMLSLLGENTVITYGRFFCLTKKQTFGRFADILLCLSQRVYKMDKFPLQLSRKELGELASMSVESIARIIAKFKEEKLINIDSENIEILDFDKLQLISQNG